MKTHTLAAIFCIVLLGAVTCHAEAGREYEGAELQEQKTSAAATLPARLEIRENRIVRQYDARLFGLGYSWGELDYLPLAVLPEGAEYPEINPDYIQLMQSFPLPFARNGEAISQLCHWRGAVGPMAERTVQKIRRHLPAGAMVAGPAEWIKAVRAVNPDAEIVWTFNMKSENADDAAGIAQFLCGSTDTPLGALRAESGLPEPVKIAVWELGNEMDFSEKNGMPLETYLARCREIIAAVRKIVPDARFAAHTVTSPLVSWQRAKWPEWHRRLLAEIGADLDYIVFHVYYHGYSTASVESMFLDVLRDDIAASPHPEVKIFLSEHAKWPPDMRERGFHTHALTGCLSTGEFLIRMLARPEIGAAAYHVHNGLQWAVMNRDFESGKLYTTGMFELFRLFGKIPWGADVVETSLEGDFCLVNGDMQTSAAAIRTPGALYLLICNRLPETGRRIEVVPGGKRRLRSVAVLSAPEMLSRNTAQEKPIQILEKRYDTPQPVSELEIPARSLTLFELIE